MTFYVERWNGNGWVTLLAAEHQISPFSFTVPDSLNGVPQAASHGNQSVFAGLPGWKARVRFNDTVIEEYDWDKIPVNPMDEESDKLWGWKLINRNYLQVDVNQIAGPFSVMG